MGDTEKKVKKKPKLTRRLVWRLPVVMAERGVYTKTELHRLMTGIGFEISTVHIGRIFKGVPELLNTELLLGLMQVLDCNLTDLIWVENIKPDGTDDSKGDGGAEKKTDDGAEKKTDDGAEKKTDDGTEKKTDDGAEKKTDDGAEKKTDDGAEKKTDDGAEKKTDDVSGEKSRRGPKGGNLKLVKGDAENYDPDFGPPFGARRNLRAESLTEERDETD